MTIIETPGAPSRTTTLAARGGPNRAGGHGRTDGRAGRRVGAAGTRPAPARPMPIRPGGSPVRYRGSGVPMSRVSHRRRTITPATTFGLALLAALITVWLGLIADFGASAAGRTPAVPDQLGVVRVHDGESLQRLAARVAPGAPTREVVDRIRELNKLDSAALDAGQTLIAPIG